MFLPTIANFSYSRSLSALTQYRWVDTIPTKRPLQGQGFYLEGAQRSCAPSERGITEGFALRTSLFGCTTHSYEPRDPNIGLRCVVPWQRGVTRP